MGCAKDEESFQLRSTAEKASFWLLSFLASPKEEVAEADNVIVKVVEQLEETFTWCAVQKTPASVRSLRSRSSRFFFLPMLPYARSIFFFSLDATATLIHTAAKSSKYLGYLVEFGGRLVAVCIRVFFAPFSDEDEDPLSLATKMGEKKKEKTFA